MQKIKDSQIQYLRTTYDSIKQRCYNPNNPAFKNYGGRQILLASEWKNNRQKFIQDIITILGHRPSAKHQLDRIDVNDNYAIENLRWATVKENNRNKRNNHLIKIGNETKILKEWADGNNLSSHLILWRIENNWPDEKILIPAKKSNKEFDALNLRAIYDGIKARCCNPQSSLYKNYGERGILMHNNWINNYHKFKQDIIDSLGSRPSSKHQLDRINVNGHYEINNLRWASPKENCRNRRNNTLIEIEGQVKTLVEWSEISNVNRSTIQKRIKSGYSGKDLLVPNIQKRFNEEQIRNIKALSNQGISMRALAKQFNCGHTTILDILHNRRSYSNKEK